MGSSWRPWTTDSHRRRGHNLTSSIFRCKSERNRLVINPATLALISSWHANRTTDLRLPPSHVRNVHWIRPTVDRGAEFANVETRENDAAYTICLPRRPPGCGSKCIKERRATALRALGTASNCQRKEDNQSTQKNSLTASLNTLHHANQLRPRCHPWHDCHWCRRQPSS